MSMICKNGTQHTHETVRESWLCWRAKYRPEPVLPPVPVAPVVGDPGHCTHRQLDYIRDLGGDPVYAAKLSREKASEYIDDLKARRKPVEKKPDIRLDMAKSMLELVPDGYFAVTPEEGAHIDFIRVSRPKATSRNQYAGATKIQTQHGPHLEIEAVLWPSGKWSVYKDSIVDKILMLVTQHHEAAIRYAEKLGRCCRCNCELTDRRSRWYGIGPECEQKPGWLWVLEEKDDRSGGTFEYLARHGLLPDLEAVVS